MRPLIGLTTYGEQAKFGRNDTFSAVLPMAYVQAVHESGGRAVLIPQDDPGTDVLDDLDGIIFTGGPDVSPALLRRRAARAHGDPPGPGRRRDAAAAGRARRRPADAGDLPGHAADGRRVRRPAAPAPAGRARPRRAPADVRPEVRHRTTCGSRPDRSATRCSARRRPSTRTTTRALPTSAALTRDRLGARRPLPMARADRDRRGPDPPVRDRRAVAPGGHRRFPPVRGAGEAVGLDPPCGRGGTRPLVTWDTLACAALTSENVP